ncbi:MAG TPA: hypothetical protein VI818_03510 [Candidatus Thermoplasmatota archaeon]|nr:hypothetical protein [Candidatus Thermoplasmatota archaeon]
MGTVVADPSPTSTSSAASSAPIELTWKGRVLTRTEVLRIYVWGSALLLALGVGLNWLLTDGAWYVRGNTKYDAQYLRWNAYDVVSGVILVASLVLLGIGFLWRARRRHIARALGFLVFGFYWGTQAMKLYVAEEGDFVNAIFAMFGVFFFNYFAYHELVSFKRDEDPRALAWLTGTAFITTGVYFVTHKIQAIAYWLILRVSEETQWLLQAFGQGTVRCGGVPDGSMIYYPQIPEIGCDSGGYFLVQIILACTAIQSMMIFVGGIFALRPPRLGDGVSGKATRFERLRPTYGSRRFWALMLTVPLIYVLNLFRNVIIIWMSGQEEPVSVFWWNTADEVFWFSHNIIGKGGSLLALIIIAFIVFQILPELYDSIIGLLDLKERRGPLEQALFGGRGKGGVAASATIEPTPVAATAAPPEPRPE